MKMWFKTIPGGLSACLVLILFGSLAFPLPNASAISFPVVETADGGFQASSGGGIVAVNLPDGAGGITSGDLLVAVISCKAVGCGAGENASWNIINEESAGSSFVNSRIFTRIADGTETATSAFTTATNTQWAYQTYRIVGHDDSVPVESASATSAASPNTTPDPPSLNPVGWDVENTLWLAVVSWACPSTFTEVTADPTGYTTIRTGNRCEENNWPTDVGLSVEGTSRQAATDSQDPSAFTISQSQRWNTFTIAVRPQADPPLVTLAASNVSDAAARLNGRLDFLFSGTVLLGFRWGDTASLGNWTANLTRLSTGTYSILLMGLEPNTTYFFAAVSEEVPSGYASQGTTLTFTTEEAVFDFDIIGLFALVAFIVFVIGGSTAIAVWVIGSRRRGSGGV